mgnify:CR=1 FL=1
MAVRVGINGFGRIGRCVLRSALALGERDLEFVAVNDLTDAHTLAHLLKYDSVHGRLDGVSAKGDTLLVQGREIKVVAVRDPASLPWRELRVEIAIELTPTMPDWIASPMAMACELELVKV